MFGEDADEHFGRALSAGPADPDASVFTRFTVQLGILVGFTAFLAIVMHMLKQSTIVAYILVGVIMQQIFNALDVTPHMSTLSHFSHIGIIMLLFMAGLEVDIPAFLARAKLVSTVGLGQIFINTLVGMATGYFIVGSELKGAMGLVYFGLCCTFSSTIIVLGMLKKTKQMESLHGQICLGLLVFQDITAVLSLAILTAATKKEPMEGCYNSNTTIEENNNHRLLGNGGNMTTGIVDEEEQSLGIALVLLVMWLLLFGFLQYLSSKFVLHHLFRALSSSKELLYLGTLGYALFSAGLADAVGFSAEIAAFLAGVSMTVLPYKLEIEGKVESIKNLGILTFFITLGMDLEFDLDPVLYLASVIAALMTLFVTMGIVVFLGWAAHLKARPTFYIGGIVNQISEFSLILASLCVERGIFCKDVLTVLAIACVITIIGSGTGHANLEAGWAKFGHHLKFLDDRADDFGELDLNESELEGHVVCFGINRLTQMVAQYAVEKLNKKHILVVSLDTDKIRLMEHHPIIKTLYADMFDPDTWDHAALENAEMVVSVLDGEQEAELSIGRYIREHNGEGFFMCATKDDEQALELYEAGCDFVIQTHALAAMKLEEMLNHFSLKNLGVEGAAHKERLCVAFDRKKQRIAAMKSGRKRINKRMTVQNIEDLNIDEEDFVISRSS